VAFFVNFSVVLSVLGSSVFIGTAQAASVPNSSYSYSLTVSPMLLDYTTLAFAIPSRLGRDAGLHSYDEQLLGSVSAGGSSFGLLSGRNMVGAAWARGSEALRFGVALQATQTERERLAWVDNDRIRRTIIRRTERALEPIVAVTRISGDTSVDVAISLRRFESEERLAYRDSTIDRVDLLEEDPSFRPELLIRFGTPLSDRSELRAAAGWASRSVDYTGSLQNHRPFEHSDYGHVWFAESAVRTRVRSRAVVIGSVEFEQRKLPEGQSRAFAFSQFKQDRVGLTIATEADLIADKLTALVGAHWAYVIFQTRRREIPTRRESTTTFDSFSWGLAYKWRNLALLGHVSNTLTVEDLFYSLDVELSL